MKEYTSKFKKEIKGSILTAVVAAFGFLMALSWRETIQEYISLIGFTSTQNKLIGSLVITLISVIGIMITTKFLSDEHK